MADLIDRQAAIDAVEEYAARLQMVNWKENPNVPYKVHSLNWCVNTIRGLPSAQPEDKCGECDAWNQYKNYPRQWWIPCSERLPEEKGEYLVTYHPCYWDNVKAEVKVGIDSFCGKTSWSKRKHQRVIAWMPLPEPPRLKEL